MNFTQHPSNNLVLGAPKDWDQNKTPCGALPVTRVDVGGGVNAMASYWKPSAEELAALARGAQVILWVYGDSHPPVSVEVETQ